VQTLEVSVDFILKFLNHLCKRSISFTFVGF